jgi:hypothetical protein
MADNPVSLPLGRKNVAVFDEHRNSSRVWPVPPTALPEAEAALEAFKRSRPDLYEWVASGAPNLSHGQHLSLFGETFKAVRAKKSGAPRERAV